jgi:hypothetical protein
MKNYKYILLLILGLFFLRCSLQEKPPFLANENVYGTANNATTALNGLYQSLQSYFYYGNEFMANTSLGSGFSVTGRGGMSNTNAFNASTGSLKPQAGSLQINNVWMAIYQSIGRANDAIQSAIVKDNPVTTDDLVINDVIGQAYFLRAFNYFNLVRLWGEVPLRTAPTTKETVALAKSSVKEIYDQIISDIKVAQQLMNGAVGNGTAKPEAADMLLAKVYMTLATAPADLQESGLNYWQLAYDEAIKVYGQYSLLPNYSDLFNEPTSDNSVESIFELQSSIEASLDITRAFTPSWYINIYTFGWIKVNVEVYDLHVTTYPSDPRLDITYISTWTRQNNGSIEKDYPVNISRPNFQSAFPSFFKLGSHDTGNTTSKTSKNFAIYRYADLLLMLAEISNELQNGEQLGYVEEVLERVGLQPQPEYSGDQASFRKAIMKEYQFELLFEGQDWFTNRRRGYDYFLNNVIIPHNTYSKFKASVDVTLETDEATVMYFPFPDNEINANQAISK